MRESDVAKCPLIGDSPLATLQRNRRCECDRSGELHLQLHFRDTDSFLEPIEVFNRAIENCKPSVEVRSKRVGGAAYQVPMQVNRNRQQSLGIRWMLQAVREKKGRATHEKLAEEILAAYKREGAAVTKRDACAIS